MAVTRAVTVTVTVPSAGARPEPVTSDSDVYLNEPGSLAGCFNFQVAGPGWAPTRSRMGTDSDGPGAAATAVGRWRLPVRAVACPVASDPGPAGHRGPPGPQPGGRPGAARTRGPPAGGPQRGGAGDLKKLNQRSRNGQHRPKRRGYYILRRHVQANNLRFMFSANCLYGRCNSAFASRF